MTIPQRYKKIAPTDINPKWVYVGYYWYSDHIKPIVLQSEEFIATSIFNDPERFVVEGNLYCPDEEISYQIKNIDGQYHIAEINLKGLLDTDNYKEIDYHTHDIKGFHKYSMIEAWEETDLYPDWMVGQLEHGLSLPNMKTLVPAWAAFKGFR